MQIEVNPWISRWLLVSAVIVIWDSGYVLLRPLTMQGGVLFPIWKPYKLYATVDLVYGDARWKSGDRFCEAQSVCNLVEVALQFLALYLLTKKKQVPAAALVIIIAQAFTFWKTILYWLYDILGGLESTGHNPMLTWIGLYIIPNGLWIVIPLLVTVEMSAQVLRVLNSAQKASKEE